MVALHLSTLIAYKYLDLFLGSFGNLATALELPVTLPKSPGLLLPIGLVRLLQGDQLHRRRLPAADERAPQLRTPTGLAPVRAAALIALGLIIRQLSSVEAQPYIYFQY